MRSNFKIANSEHHRYWSEALWIPISFLNPKQGNIKFNQFCKINKTADNFFMLKRSGKITAHYHQ